MNVKRSNTMEAILLGGLLVALIVLQAWILPKMGIRT